jgi:Sulfatase
LTGWQHLALGLALPMTGWCVSRLTVDAGLKPATGLVADGALPLFGHLLVFVATSKPIFAGSLITAIIAAFAVADRLKRCILLEPVVLADAHQTIDILVRHPELNALFSKNRFVIWIGLAAAGLLAGVFFWDPSVWPWSPWPGLAAAAAAAAAGWSIKGPLLSPLAGIFLQAGMTADPARDAKILGPFAMHLAYAVIARAERPARCAAVRPSATSAIRRRSGALAPVVVVQCESFFDPRRLHPALPADLLPAFDNCRSDAIQFGRLSVPGFGANSVRTEFAVLSGLAETAIGFDRFNPYLCFARSPIRSLAWRMRAAGYRTICVHPFDRRFYRRDRVMHNLGFDVFISEEAFSGAACAGPYVADVEVARRVAEILLDEGPNVFVFAITMENHGPWDGVFEPPDTILGLPEFASREAFGGFLRGVKSADAMLGILTDRLRAQTEAAVLAFYGDHLPCLRSTFRQFGFDDRRTDYVIWSPGVNAPLAIDLTAPELSRAIWDAWQLTVLSREPSDLLGLDKLVAPTLHH